MTEVQRAQDEGICRKGLCVFACCNKAQTDPINLESVKKDKKKPLGTPTCCTDFPPWVARNPHRRHAGAVEDPKKKLRAEARKASVLLGRV